MGSGSYWWAESWDSNSVFLLKSDRRLIFSWSCNLWLHLALLCTKTRSKFLHELYLDSSRFHLGQVQWQVKLFKAWLFVPDTDQKHGVERSCTLLAHGCWGETFPLWGPALVETDLHLLHPFTVLGPAVLTSPASLRNKLLECLEEQFLFNPSCKA